MTRLVRIGQTVMASLAVLVALAVPARAGSLAWLDEVIQRVIREGELGSRAVVRAEGRGVRSSARVFVSEAEESLESLTRRSDAIARWARPVDESADAALSLRFQRLVQPDAAWTRTFQQLAPAEKRLVVELGEAARSLARRYPGQAETIVRRLGVEGLAAVRAYGDDVAEVIVREGPETVNVLRRTGRGGWAFFNEHVLPHKGKLVAAGVFAAFLANPERFVDTAGRATQFAVEQFGKAGLQLAGAVSGGAARGLERAVGSALESVGLNHPLLRGLLTGVVALIAVIALLVLLGLPARTILRPITGPLRWMIRLRA
ncbi:MAG: hypothetical protein KatS3mg108_0470 [Isosphaeraceae bacterium]|jgi:hypothetical protein|nr:MAG: hypothetical protein KatS3mg108_0470 [Isosphaeraceae bacterium]